MTKAILSHPSRPVSTGTGRYLLWTRKNLFSSWSNTLLTLFCLWLMWELIPLCLTGFYFRPTGRGQPVRIVRKPVPAGCLSISGLASLCMVFTRMNSVGVLTWR